MPQFVFRDVSITGCYGYLAGAGLMLHELLAKGYSRDLELEADREGARLPAAAGFDRCGAVRGLTLGLSTVKSEIAGFHPPQFFKRLRVQALARLVDSWVFGIRPADPATIAAACAFLAAVAVIASAATAMRATRTDLTSVLRQD